jgi:hypothetical protein
MADKPAAREDELLEQEDGRYFGIGKVGTGLGSIATSERLGKKEVVSFGLPSGPALFLHLAHGAYTKVKGIDPLTLFDRHAEGTWPDDQGPLFDYLESCIAHAVFSFNAIEAFANEVIPPSFTYTIHRDGADDLGEGGHRTSTKSRRKARQGSACSAFDSLAEGQEGLAEVSGDQAHPRSIDSLEVGRSQGVRTGRRNDLGNPVEIARRRVVR